MPTDKHISQLLQRALKGAKRPYLLADHLALTRMGPASISAIRDSGATYVDNPATHWVLQSFQKLSPEGSGGKERAQAASKVLDELVQLNKGADDRLRKVQDAIQERIEKRRAGQTDPAANEWFDKFRDQWKKAQPMSISGELDFDGYPDSPASPSPQRYLNSFLSLIDALGEGEIVLVSGSPTIVNNVNKFTEDDGNVQTIVVGED